MSNLAVLKYFLSHPKEIITLGYQAMLKKKSTVDYQDLVLKKFGKTKFPTLDILSLFPGFEGVINEYSFLPGTSTVIDILVLKELAKRFEKCRYFEIGSFRGESIAAVAEVAEECNALTLSVEQMKALNFEEDHVRVHGIFSKNTPNIATYYHDSKTFDFTSMNKKFDLIYIDGQDTFDTVSHETRNVFKLLRDERSVIVWHNYEFKSGATRYEIIAAILSGMPEQYHDNLYHISNSMFAVFMRGDLSHAISKDPVYPDKVFRVEVKARRF